MNRNYQSDTHHLINYNDLIRQTAFHEAGHAAAIYLYNKQKQLPPVHFQIAIKSLNRQKHSHLAIDDNLSAVVEGGLLIHGLPLALLESAHYFSVAEHDAYQIAFEADMINLLIGPLAEAKYVALYDDEPFNAQLININALHNYGGSSDLNKIHEYLDIFIADRGRHQEKLAQLFDKAFQFINSSVHWQAIERLAHHILNNPEDIISCEEAIIVLDKA
ncbi:MAG: hypothetical protein WCL60_00595 [Methylococcales bacterium]